MEDKKNHILDVAKVRFDKFGFKKTTVDEIAGDAGVSKRTLYELFEDKESLFVALFIREALTARRVVLGRLEDVRDPVERLKRFMLVARDYFEHEPFMAKALRDEDNGFIPYLKKEFYVGEQGILDIFSGFLKEGIRQGKFRNLNTGITSYILFKLLQAFTYARTLPAQEGLSTEEEMEELTKFLVEAIVKRKV
ncbi:TetR/AcrR family transcriptional regulator [Candidatus Poribacteria bacterium]|nr:TetR/AcrR family transcriptional regulator [Candidatus Poribacteria bacterium]